jgi:hypothetical protein
LVVSSLGRDHIASVGKMVGAIERQTRRNQRLHTTWKSGTLPMLWGGLGDGNSLCRFIRQLENAADNSGHEQQLRRAALRLRNTDGLGLDPVVDRKFDEVCRLTWTSRPKLATAIIRDWLVANGYLPPYDLDEETELGGAA